MRKAFADDIGKRLILSFVVCLLFFVSTEILSRIYFALKFGKPYYLLYGIASTETIDSLLRRGLGTALKFAEKPGAKSTSPEEGYYTTPIEMRCRKIAISKPINTFRIIALGGSTTWGAQAKDDETYPYYLEEMLNYPQRAYAKRFEVINAGISGADIAKLTDVLKNEMVKLNPDLVIIYVGWNDVMSAIQVTNNAETLSNKTVLWLMRHSLFFVSIREKLAYMLHKHAEYAWCQFKKDKPSADIILDHPSFGQFEYNLRQLIGYLGGRKIKSVLIRFPYRIYHDKPTPQEFNLTSYFWKPAIEKIYAIMDSVSRETGTPVIDCETRFNNIDKTKLFFDVMHMTPEGNKIFAEVVYNYLQRHGDLIPRM